MIKEYHFAAVSYDEEKNMVRCTACGKTVLPSKVLYRSGGRWVCGKCLFGVGQEASEAASCRTVKSAIAN